MPLLSLQNICLSFGGLQLLGDVTIHVEPEERICLIGRNGAGKSTLLKLMNAEIEPDDGRVSRQSGLKTSCLTQEIPEGLEGSTRDVILGGIGADEKDAHWISTVLSRLSLDGDAEFSTLSGGQKRRVLLGKALVCEPDLLFLDEPTNHLDLDAIEWLERFLQKWSGAIVFVSHDRVFVDHMATRIVELDRGKLSSWPGGYRDYVEQKQHALEVEERQRAEFDKKLAREETWVRQGIKARRTRNEGRVRALKKLREERRARLDVAGNAKMTLQEGAKSGKKVIELVDASFGYGTTTLIRTLSTTISRGDKVGIIGPNGVGKTTLIKLLLGEHEPASGKVKLGVRLQVAYLDQLREEIDDTKTLIENVAEGGDTVTVGGAKKHIIGYLQDFLFDPDAARAPASNLSGGERNRLLLAKLFTRPSNVLVLDEPTNDLDIPTLELLEALLVEYKGTVLLVSHDREFLNNVVTSTSVFEGDGVVTEYAGGYDDWLLQSMPRDGDEKKKRKIAKQKPKPAAEGPRKLTFKERAELLALPGLIEQLEEERDALQENTTDPSFYRGDPNIIREALGRLEAIEPELEAAYERWTSLEERV
ncbi:MAG: ATP-binding cassette domain-containing protein [Deltaproteobacteria bacterium]|nr:ATP-binding cassette domain-containing protein [Deltaproteobacteria bacterium]